MVGIDLYSTQTEFKVKNNETLTLATPTMDGGTIYKIKIAL